MSRLIRADPARLDHYTEVTVPSIARGRGAIEEYRRAIAAFNAARPNDLGSHLDDLSGPLLESLDRLTRLDELPAAFAAALRHLDHSYTDTADGQVLSTEDRDAFHLLVTTHLAANDDDLFDELRRTGQWIEDQRNRLGRLGEYLGRFPERIDVSADQLVPVLRRTVIVVEEITANAWRRAVVTVDQWEYAVVRWSTTLDFQAFRRAAPALRKIGVAGDAMSGVYATWEQRDQDTTRTDLSSTERALRAGADGLVRGGAQFAVSAASGLMAAPFVVAAPVTGGVSLIPAGAIIAGGVAFGEWLDPRLGRGLDGFYEVPAIARGIDRAGEGIDAAGRKIRDAAEHTVDDVGNRISEVWPFLAERSS